MAKNSESAPKIFRIKRLQIGVNVVVQLALAVMIVAMVNALSFTHFKRWDFTRSQKYSLSDKTKHVLRDLPKPVKVFVFFPAPFGAEVFGDVDSLLKEYQYASKKKVEVETVDVYRDLTRAREITNKFKLTNENVVVLVYGDRTKVVTANDMADYDFSGAMSGQPPRLRAFKGEQALTGALIGLTQETQSKIYALQGHGEFELNGDPLQTLKTFIEHENIKIEALNLMNVESIPDDAKALLVLGPKYDFTAGELKMLGDYWTKKGRIFVALDASAKLARLSDWLRELGVTRVDDRIIVKARTNVPGVVVVVQEPPAVFLQGSPVTKKLDGVETQLIGGTQSLALNVADAPAKGLHLQPLAEVRDKRFWGEVDYQDLEHAFFDPKNDHAVPMTVAASVEKGATNDPRIKVDSSRMIVVGCAGFVTSDALEKVGQNLDFLINSVNWLLAREELLGISPKVRQQFALNLSDDQLRSIALLTWGGFVGNLPGVGDALSRVPVVTYLNFVPLPGVIPLAAGLLGFLVWWRRRR